MLQFSFLEQQRRRAGGRFFSGAVRRAGGFFFLSRKICSGNSFLQQKREPDNFWVYLFYRKVFLDQIQRTVFG